MAATHRNGRLLIIGQDACLGVLESRILAECQTHFSIAIDEANSSGAIVEVRPLSSDTLIKVMETRRFENLVRRAINELPPAFLERMENVDVVVEYWASREQLVGSGLDEREMLLGLYEGIPLPDRYDYNLVLPDKITLFQRAIESICNTDDEVVAEVRATIIHEVAHHFGIDDEALHEIGID